MKSLGNVQTHIAALAKGRNISVKSATRFITAEHRFEVPGRYTAAVKVVDIFGNDTMTLAQLSGFRVLTSLKY